jgi:hypothetical protein
MPSAMSTRTTVRASDFSARRCAAVAPTFPAPTTVILLTIPIGMCERTNARAREKRSPIATDR